MKGRPRRLNKKQQQKLKDLAENHVGTSQRKLVLKFKMSQSFIHRNFSKFGLNITRDSVHQNTIRSS
jgi:transposase